MSSEWYGRLTESLEQRALLQRDQIRSDDRRDGHESSAAHACHQATDEERDHRRCEAAQGGPAGEEGQRDQEGVPAADDVGEAAIQRRERRGAQQVAGAEQSGLVRLFKRRRDVRDQGRDLVVGG